MEVDFDMDTPGNICDEAGKWEHFDGQTDERRNPVLEVRIKHDHVVTVRAVHL